MKPSSRKSMSAKMSRTSIIITAIALVVLTASVVTALSMRSQSTAASTKRVTATKRNLVTSNASGQIVVLNQQTGQSRPLTPDEARRLAEGIKQLVNQSTDGLVQIYRADGSVSMDLQGRFQNVMLAKKEADGTVSTACVDNPEAAASFFEIDPALLGLSSRPVSQSPKPKFEDR